METVCYPAMEEVAQELRLQRRVRGAKSLPPEEGQQLGHLDLLVHMGEEQNFVYQIWPQQYSVPGFTYRARSGKIDLLPAGNLPVRRQPGQRPDGLQQRAGDHRYS